MQIDLSTVERPLGSARRALVGARAAVVPLVAAGIGYGVVLSLGAAGGVPADVLTRDPAAVAGTPPWVGLVSNLGILIWCAAATACAFAATVVAGGRQRAFLAAAAAVTAWLMLDDLFLLHESILPLLTGLPQKAIYAGYAVAIGAFFAAFRRELWAGERGILALAVGFLGASMGMDVVLPDSAAEVAWIAASEDLLKILGIVAWAAFFVRAARARLRAG